MGSSESVPLPDGGYERICQWCGEAFRASRRDAVLCSAKCRTDASRYDALRDAVAATAAASRCIVCGDALGDARASTRFCGEACRQRLTRHRRADDEALAGATPSPRVRVCAGPSCSTVFTISSRSGRPRVYCSARCRVARHRSDAATREATS
jgi:predicted nucleic acid-binding Zn ribbon protein